MDTERKKEEVIAMYIGEVFGRSADKRDWLFVFSTVLSHYPEIANPALIQLLTKTAATDSAAEVRLAAQRALDVLVKKRPDMVDAALANTVTRAAEMDNDPSVRKAAQETLQLLVEKRTELVDVAFAAAVTRIAATDAAASIRQVAQKTLQLLVQKRPDLASTVLTESFPISRDRFDERFVQLTNCLLTLRPA